jgi:hypothetical protein
MSPTTTLIIGLIALVIAARVIRASATTLGISPRVVSALLQVLMP